MRTVVNPREVGHLWAHQSQDYARTSGGNVSFRGQTFYSYSTPIGYVETNKQGETAYLVTTRRHSVTTSGKHMPAMRGAISYDATVFHVAYVVTERNGRGSHAERLQEYAARIGEVEAKIPRAHTRKDCLESERANLYAEARRYCQFYGLADAFDADTVAEIISKAEAARKREAARQKRETARLEKERRQRYTEAAAAWLAGGANADAVWYHPDTFLRVVGEDVQTSKGATVPLAHALRLFNLWATRQVKTGERVGLYNVSKVEAGTLTIGCHVITAAEIARFAASQGWTATSEASAA